MKFTKKIAIFLAAVTAVGSLAACGPKEPVGEDGKMTIRWMGFPIDGTGKPDSDIEKYIEEKFDVELEPIFITYGEYTTKKSMMLAGDDIPDVIYEMDPKHVQQDADQGYIANVPYEFIKEHAPDIYNVLNENEPRVWSYSRVGEDNYGIPNLSYTGNNVKIGIWREDWLNNVGITKVPETIDEMGEALYKFTHEDPDGNGKKDTYGMSGSTAWNTMFIDIFGAYGAAPFNWVKTDDGKYVYGGLQQETVDALATLRDWYSKGVIHPDFVTTAACKEDYANGKYGYMNTLGGYSDPTDNTTVQNLTVSLNPEAKVVNAPPVKGPDGKSGGFIWGAAAQILAFGQHLENDEAKLAKILEILKTMVGDEEVMKRVRIGEEGVHYKLSDGSAEIADGIDFLAPYDDAAYRRESGLVYDFAAPSFFMPVTQTYDTYKKYSYKKQLDAYNEVAAGVKGTADAFLKADVLPSASEYHQNLKNAQIKLMTEVITGEKELDAYLGEFTATWEQYGGKILEEETVEVADAIEDILAEVGVK